jgi:glycosyltransferase involved in cell wall biosynthesis
MKVSIIIPAYNEEKRIGKTLEKYSNFFHELKKKKILDFEILIIINNTNDKTEEIVKRFQKKFREIIFLNFKGGGKGFAIIKGFENALKRDNDLIGFVDADMATPPEAFYDLFKKSENYEGVIASRALKGAKANFNFKRKITHKGFNFIVRSFFLFPYKDTQCGAKLFKRIVIKKITPELSLTKWAFDVNVLYLCKKNKFKIKELPTVWDNKDGSKITSLPKVSLQMFFGILRLRIIMSRFEPLARQIKFIAQLGDKLINK